MPKKKPKPKEPVAQPPSLADMPKKDLLQSIRDEVIPALLSVVESQQFIMGEAVRMLEAEVARTAKVAFVPFLLDGVAADSRLNQPDGMHPTAAGHQVIADRLWPSLRPLLTPGK